MELSSFAGALGRAFTGQGIDQDEDLKRQQLARANSMGDTQLRLQLMAAGLGPSPAPGAPPAAGQSYAPPLAPGASTTAAPDIPGGPSAGSAPIPAPGATGPSPSANASALRRAFTVPFSSGAETFAPLPYEQTPQGQALSAAEAKDAAHEALVAKQKADGDAAKAALEAVKDRQTQAKELRQAQADYTTLAALDPKNPLVLKGPPTDGALGGNYAKAIDFVRDVRKNEAAQSKEHWVAAGVDKESGQPLILNTLTGETKIGGGVKGAGAGLSGQTMMTLSRMGMSRQDLEASISAMEKQENHPEFLNAITPTLQAENAAAQVTPNAEAHGFLGVLNNSAGSLVSGMAQKDLPPDYRTYQNNAQRVALAFTELLPRPNQQLLGMEKGLSGADVGWNPALLSQIQQRRRNGLTMLDQILKGTPAGNLSGVGASAAPTAAPAATAVAPPAAADPFAALIPPKP